MKKFFSPVLIFLLLILPLHLEIKAGELEQDKGIPVIERDELEELISKRKGKPLLLNIWATWCVPCREEFPDLVKLKKLYGEEIDIAAISVDYPDEIEGKIKPFLEEVGYNFPVYVNGFKPEAALIDFLEKEWNGALPATFIYKENGERVAFMQGKKSLLEFEAELKKLGDK